MNQAEELRTANLAETQEDHERTIHMYAWDPDAEIQVDPTRHTVWVNSSKDGSCIGRFSKRFGMDTHKTGTQQMVGEGECLYCTHTPGTEADWHIFIQKMLYHYGVPIPSSILEW